MQQPYRIAVVFLHADCNMTCTFCVTENTVDTMGFDQATRVLAVLKQRSVDNVVLGGGEPFAWPGDTVGLAARAKELGFVVQVGTNGIAMPENYSRIDSIDRYVLPLDAADASVHNELRRYGNRHHAIILDRLEALRRRGKTVTVSTVVTARNIHALSDLSAFLARYRDDGGRIHAWHLYKFIPEGRGGRRNADSLRVSDSDYDAACNRAKGESPGVTVFKRKDMFHSKSVDFFWYEKGTMRVGSEVWKKTPVGHEV
jgi:pyruvate-formate lyase-activating enzyme